jgi:hypothetical protein
MDNAPDQTDERPVWIAGPWTTDFIPFYEVPCEPGRGACDANRT